RSCRRTRGGESGLQPGPLFRVAPGLATIIASALDVDPLHDPEPPGGLAEMRRVLKPGGSFHFVEHGHASDEKVVRWQERLEPINERLAGGCHLNRHISEDIERAGFDIQKLDTYHFKGEPKPMGYTYEG